MSINHDDESFNPISKNRETLNISTIFFYFLNSRFPWVSVSKAFAFWRIKKPAKFFQLQIPETRLGKHLKQFKVIICQRLPKCCCYTQLTVVRAGSIIATWKRYTKGSLCSLQLNLALSIKHIQKSSSHIKIIHLQWIKLRVQSSFVTITELHIADNTTYSNAAFHSVGKTG